MPKYTDRDYAALRAGMLADAPNHTPEWTNFNEDELGVALVELFAGSLDILSYSLDKNADEAFLDTAVTKASVQRILRLIGYTMRRRVAASARVRFALANGASNTTLSNVVVPAGTTLRTRTGMAFVTVEEGRVLPGFSVTEADVLALEGAYHAHGLALAGTADRKIVTLPTAHVAENSLVVRVNGIAWTEEKHIPAGGMSTNTAVYRTTEDAFGVLTLEFSRFFGAVPASGDVVTATYVTTNGPVGNIGANTITAIPTQPGALPNGYQLVVTNPLSSTGGLERESVSEARANGPRWLRTLGRAVTVQDFIDLLLVQPAVESVNVVNHAGYVEIYVRMKKAPGALAYPLFKLEPPSIYNLTAFPADGTIVGPGVLHVAVTSVDAAGRESHHVLVNPATGLPIPSANPRSVAFGAGSTFSAQVRVSMPPPTGAVTFNVYAGFAADADAPRPALRRVAAGISPENITGASPYTVTSLPTGSAPLAPTRNDGGAVSAATGDSEYQTLYDFLAQRSLLGTTFDLFNAQPAAQNVSLSLAVKENFRRESVRFLVEEATKAFFTGRPLGQPFYYTELEQYVFANVEGVRNVAVQRSSADDPGVVAVGAGNYATLGTVTFSPAPSGGVEG